ncbi:MAG TPA: hypothetical protein VF171_07465, partial [Trueperaceae bacterium]
MFWYLLLSAIAAGIIATSVMVGMLYIPLLWGGKHFDVLGALGSAVTRQDDGRARVLGALLYYAGGLLFSLLYGWAALALLTTSEPVPQWLILRGPPV